MRNTNRLPPEGRLGDLRVFLEILRRGSFVAAARELGLSQPSISRRLAQMEQQLGARLLRRDTRGLSATEDGERWRAHAERILAAHLEAEEELAAAAAGGIGGRLSIAAPASFGRRHLPPVLRGFLEAHPGVEIDVVLADRYGDLVREGFDVAIRIGALSDSRLVARRLGPNRRRLVASPAYLARRGAPAHPAELPSHDCLGFTPLESGDIWHFEGPEEPVAVRIGGRLRANNAELLLEAALDGLGIGLPADFLSAEHLRSGALVELLPEWRPRATDIHAVWPDRQLLPRRVTAFVAACAAAWRQPPWALAGDA